MTGGNYWGRVHGAESRFGPRPEPGHQPSEGDQIVLFNGLDLYHKSTDSTERQYKSWT